MNLFLVKESVKMSLRSIGSNKIRSFLTALGVMIGVAAVIALVALGNGAKKSVESSFESLGANLLTLNSGTRAGPGVMMRGFASFGGSSAVFTEEDLEAVKAIGNEWINLVAPESSSNSQVKYKNLNTNASIIGTGTEYPEIRNFSVSLGSFFTENDMESRKSVAVIGYGIYTTLFPDQEDPIGESIKIRGKRFKIIGIMEEKGDWRSDSSIFIPASTYKRHISGSAKYNSIYVQAAEQKKMNELQEILENKILELHNLPDMGSADFAVINQLNMISTIQGVAGTFTLLLAGIASISLIVGGIGIMNIMLVSVTERTREIGIRMALGAKARDILSQFLTESIIISLGGGIIGIGAGFAASRLAAKFFNMASYVSIDSVILASTFSCAIGLIFGVYPAYRAAQLDPIEALRYE